jgi:hypothetical protein
LKNDEVIDPDRAYRPEKAQDKMRAAAKAQVDRLGYEILAPDSSEPVGGQRAFFQGFLHPFLAFPFLFSEIKAELSSPPPVLRVTGFF